MLSPWEVSLKRSWFLNFLLLVFSALFFIQISLFYLNMNKPALTGDFLLRAGYLGGSIGFMAALCGLLFVMVKTHRREFGILETLGYTRFQYFGFYFLHYLIVTGCSALLSLAAQGLLSFFGVLSVITTWQILVLLLLLHGVLLAIFLGVIALSILIHSAADPVLLVKE